MTMFVILLFYILVLPYLSYVFYETLLNFGRIVLSITHTLTCIISMNFVIFTYIFKHFFKTLEQNVVLTVSKSSELQKPLKVAFTNTTNLTQYDTNLMSSLYKLSDSLLLFENSQAITNLNTVNRTFVDDSLDYNSRLVTLDLFKVNKPRFDSTSLYTVKDKEFLLSSTNLPSFTSNTTYNLSPSQLNTTADNEHTLLLNLLSTQKSHDILKQSRWSLKNSFISEEFIKQNNMFLNSKRLLGNVLNDKVLTDSNIWLSNFKTGGGLKTALPFNNLNDNETLKSFSTFEESRNFLLTRYLLFVNSKTLLPSRALTTQFNKQQEHLDYNTMNYFLTQEYFTKNLFINNNILFLDMVSMSNESNLLTSGFGDNLHTSNTNNSLEFLLTGSSAITSDLTSTKPSTNTTLPTNKNVSL